MLYQATLQIVLVDTIVNINRHEGSPICGPYSENVFKLRVLPVSFSYSPLILVSLVFFFFSGSHVLLPVSFIFQFLFGDLFFSVLSVHYDIESVVI
jgi:hypothetical protein